MRDERWVHRFLFAWNDSLFFDPLDVCYEPRSDHFLSSVEPAVRERFVRSGIWWNHRPHADLPAQGWKIHVSASHRGAHAVAAAAVGYLTTHGFDFKIALDLTVLELLNSKTMSRANSGKFITVYPRDEEEFRSCLAGLARVLEGAEGAYVLSDLRYRDHRALYFRYGQFLPTHRLDVLGRKQAVVTGPDGPVPDARDPGGARPRWVPWPFPDWKPEAGAEAEGDGEGEGEGESGVVLAGRFRVLDSLQFSNSGGVYVAEDLAHGGRRVVVKEARPHTGFSPRKDYDAVDLLAREWSFLNRLGDLPSFPAPVAAFRQWEHHYIAMEFVEGDELRVVSLEHNPLLHPGFDPVRSREFLRTYLAVFRGMARAVRSAHERGVILGDRTPANLLVDPATGHVTVFDLESCRLAGPGDGGDAHLHAETELFTPGFSHSRRRPSGPSRPQDDLYALATTMAYFLFPIAAMSYLREDVMDLYGSFVDALGWPAQIHRLLKDLQRARITLDEVLEALEDLSDEDSLVARVRPDPVLPAGDDLSVLARTEAGVAAFVAAVADPRRRTLFPVDPFAHVTNPLSLGFGASGVLWALDASGFPPRPQWRDWLRGHLAVLDPEEYPDGLMTGLAGIAWAADALGMPGEARDLLAVANRRGRAAGDHTYYYGLAGLGMTDLRFFVRHGDPAHLDAARECARVLCDSVRREGGHAFWLNEFSDEPLTGLGFGQAGVAMFLLRMSQVTGDPSYRRLGSRALAWEMAQARFVDGVAVFDHEGSLEPYVEVGTAGVAKVLLRYGDLDAARTLLRALAATRFSVLPGYVFGLSGVADALLDAADITGESAWRAAALRQLDVVRRTFMFEPDERFGLGRPGGTAPLALPGEGLLRCACDYATGSAGVLRVLHRARQGGAADFLLDEAVR
jgi:tRNA A-37 threonylcarbamoyl transferase component Bud32